MDAITFLKNDHKKVTLLINKISKTSEKAMKTRKELFSKIKDTLKRHEQLEESFLYPAFKKQNGILSLIYEAKEGHSVVDKIISDLERSHRNSDQWSGRFAVLKENVKNLIKLEQKSLFPRARKMIKKAKLANMGQMMQARKTKEESKRIARFY